MKSIARTVPSSVSKIDLQDQRVGAGSGGSTVLHRRRRREQPAAVLGRAEQRGEAGAGVEAREAAPVDRPVAARRAPPSAGRRSARSPRSGASDQLTRYSRDNTRLVRPGDPDHGRDRRARPRARRRPGETGARLLLHGRDDARGRQTVEEVRARTGSDKLEWHRADLSSLEEVRDLARQIERRHERLDVLVNNAGIGTTLPGDGRASKARTATSCGLPSTTSPGSAHAAAAPLIVRRARAHRQRELRGSGADRLRRRDAGTVLQRYPGVLPEQARAGHVHVRPGRGAPRCERHRELSSSRHLHAHEDGARGRGQPATPLEQGVRAVRRLALDDELDGVTGTYFDGERESRAHGQAYDADARRRLRELSEQLTGRGTG